MNGKDGVTSCESCTVDWHQPVVFLSNRPGEIPQQDNNMTVVFSLVCMQDVWPPDAKWSLKLKFQHTGNYWSKNCTRKGYAQSHNQLFNQGNNMQLITSKTIIIIFGWVIDKNDSFVQFKFLHRVSATTYHWPRWDDMDRFHLSNIFAFCFSRPFKFQRNQLWKNSSE